MGNKLGKFLLWAFGDGAKRAGTTVTSGVMGNAVNKMTKVFLLPDNGDPEIFQVDGPKEEALHNFVDSLREQAPQAFEQGFTQQD